MATPSVGPLIAKQAQIDRSARLEKKMTLRILLIQGPNMSYLGKREPEIYGRTTAAELDALCLAHAKKRGYELDIFYTHSESAAIERLYEADAQKMDGFVMNPAAFCVTGVAIANCIKAIPLPYVEVHVSNIDRRKVSSITAPEAVGVIHGFGINGYMLALDALLDAIQNPEMLPVYGANAIVNTPHP
jgi:3-dehydroquinate dehydratase-2